MRPVLYGSVAALIALPAFAQHPSLPVSQDEARALSREALAELMFGAAAEQVVASRVDDNYFSPLVFGATFLLKPQPAIDHHIVRYEGACSVRRVRVQLDVRNESRTVEDIVTDTAWILTGPMSIAQENMDAVAGDLPADTAQRAACAGLTNFAGLVESPDALHLMLAAKALDAIPALLDGGTATVTCGDGEACDDAHRTALRTGRLTETGPCDDPWLSEALGITPEQACIRASLLLPGGSLMIYDTLEVVAAGSYDLPNRFTLSRVSMNIGTTIVD